MKNRLIGILVLCVLCGPAHGQTLKVGYGADRMSKSEAYYSFCLIRPNPGIYEPLFQLAPDWTLRPWLVEKWDVLGDHWRLHLRKGVRFHDGSELDAECVRKALLHFGKHRSNFVAIDPESYRVMDRYTLDFQAKEKGQFVHIVENLTHPIIGMIHPECDPSQNPVGTGPFRFSAYKKGQYLEVAANKEYWGDKPSSEKVIFRFIPDDQTRLMALQAGEVDIIFPVPPQLLSSLPKGSGLQVVTSPLSHYLALTVNIRGEAPFDILSDPGVRKALGFAIDREAIAEKLFSGKAQAARALLSPSFWSQGEDFLNGYRFDPEAAHRMLESSGWRVGPDGIRTKNGRSLSLTLVSGWPSASELKPLPELLQQMLHRIGVEMRIIQTDDDGVYYDTYMRPGKGDLFLEMGTNATADPTFLLYLLFHSRTPWLEYGYKWAIPGGTYDETIDKARSATDPGTIVQSIREAQRILIDEAASVIPVVHLPDFYIVRPGVELKPGMMESLTRYGYAAMGGGR